jgi:hypothetical protein
LYFGILLAFSIETILLTTLSQLLLSLITILELLL